MISKQTEIQRPKRMRRKQKLRSKLTNRRSITTRRRLNRFNHKRKASEDQKAKLLGQRKTYQTTRSITPNLKQLETNRHIFKA